jgi:hypothetical protein
VYFFGPPSMFYTNGSIRFLAPATPGMNVDQPIGSAGDLPPPPAGHRPIFIFLNARAGELAAVVAGYPGGTPNQFIAASNGGPLMTVYAPR